MRSQIRQGEKSGFSSVDFSGELQITDPEKLRIWDETGTYRVIYLARFSDAVYVLHAFQKKTQVTAKRDIELASKRYNELIRGIK